MKNYFEYLQRKRQEQEAGGEFIYFKGKGFKYTLELHVYWFEKNNSVYRLKNYGELIEKD